MDEQKLVNLKQAIALSGRTKRSVYYYMGSGLLPYRMVGKHRMMLKTDVMALREVVRSRSNRPLVTSVRKKGRANDDSPL